MNPLFPVAHTQEGELKSKVPASWLTIGASFDDSRISKKEIPQGPQKTEIKSENQQGYFNIDKRIHAADLIDISESSESGEEKKKKKKKKEKRKKEKREKKVRKFDPVNKYCCLSQLLGY